MNLNIYVMPLTADDADQIPNFNLNIIDTYSYMNTYVRSYLISAVRNDQRFISSLQYFEFDNEWFLISHLYRCLSYASFSACMHGLVRSAGADQMERMSYCFLCYNNCDRGSFISAYSSARHGVIG